MAFLVEAGPGQPSLADACAGLWTNLLDAFGTRIADRFKAVGVHTREMHTSDTSIVTVLIRAPKNVVDANRDLLRRMKMRTLRKSDPDLDADEVPQEVLDAIHRAVYPHGEAAVDAILAELSAMDSDKSVAQGYVRLRQGGTVHVLERRRNRTIVSIRTVLRNFMGDDELLGAYLRDLEEDILLNAANADPRFVAAWGDAKDTESEVFVSLRSTSAGTYVQRTSLRAALPFGDEQKVPTGADLVDARRLKKARDAAASAQKTLDGSKSAKDPVDKAPTSGQKALERSSMQKNGKASQASPPATSNSSQTPTPQTRQRRHIHVSIDPDKAFPILLGLMFMIHAVSNWAFGDFGMNIFVLMIAVAVVAKVRRRAKRRRASGTAATDRRAARAVAAPAAPAPKALASEPRISELILDILKRDAPERETAAAEALMRVATLLSIPADETNHAIVAARAVVNDGLPELLDDHRRVAEVSTQEERRVLASRLADSVDTLGTMAEDARASLQRARLQHFDNTARYITDKSGTATPPIGPVN